jgi:hypothetical protein
MTEDEDVRVVLLILQLVWREVLQHMYQVLKGRIVNRGQQWAAVVVASMEL